MAQGNNESALLTLPLDLLKHITKTLEPADETALKLTCRRMNHLIAPAPHPPAAESHRHHHHFLAVRNDPPPRDGRSTPVPQSPLPYKAAQMLQELELENREVEDREQSRGMELSDTEDGFESEDDRSVAEGASKPTKFKSKKNILNWTADLDTAPSSPSLRSPSHGSFVQSPRPASPSPRVPSFTLTTS